MSSDRRKCPFDVAWLCVEGHCALYLDEERCCAFAKLDSVSKSLYMISKFLKNREEGR